MAFFNALSNLLRRPEENYGPVEQSRSGGVGPSPVAQDLLNRGQFEPVASHTPAPTTGPMGPTKIGPDPGFWGNLGRQYARGDIDALMESTSRVVDPYNAASLDDVALRMGKPLGSFSTSVTERGIDPYRNYRVQVHDTSPGTRNYLDVTDPSVAGYIDLGKKDIEGHLPVDMTYSGSDYRGKGFGSEMYQEAIKEAQKLGYKGLASQPYLRNKYSNQIWDRPGITQADKAMGDYDLMSEWIPRGKDWPTSPEKNLFELDRTTQPMLPGVREWLLEQMRNKSFQSAPEPVTSPSGQIGPVWGQPQPLMQYLMDLMRKPK